MYVCSACMFWLLYQEGHLQERPKKKKKKKKQVEMKLDPVFIQFHMAPGLIFESL